MSASHHGERGPRREPDESRLASNEEIMRRLLAQFEGKYNRTWSEGHISPDDDGDVAFAITADQENGVVVLHFGKPVTWIGMTPEQVAQLAEALIDKAREVAKEPFSVRLGVKAPRVPPPSADPFLPT
jgi:hypothetical protein